MRIEWKETTINNQWVDRDTKDLIAMNTDADTSSHCLTLTDKRDQTIDGFGACFNELGWIALNKIDDKQREEVIKNFFDQEHGAKFNFCRMPIGASDYAAQWYSLNEQENDFEMKHFSIERDRSYLIPYINSAKKYKKDLKLFASPWSPPTWMKFPKAYNYGRLIMKEEYLKAYALYFLKFIEAYEKEGIRIDQIHIQNEPFADQKFPSCLWSGEQFRQFIGEYLGPLFEKENVDTQIWLGTLNGPEQMKFLPTGTIILDIFDEYVDHVLFDKMAKKYISGVGYQWAGREAIQRTRESYPDMKLIQTENECGDGNNTWEYARYVFNLMRHYFRNGVSSYTYWNMVLEPGGSSTWGWKQNSLVTVDPKTEEVIYNPEFYVMKHFSGYVKPGAKRIEVKGPWSGAAVAFENPNQEIIVVAANNVNYSRDMSININKKNIRVNLKGYSFNTFVITL
ncbi:glycoside hydrolase family 30 protein [Vallitalea maricola]|uniref:Glycoside hydrolase family 30 protein n=1 Tax=Vallitalea maricola TaxID=3074433 RepID=A0ACB5UH84_9FIRM|nr:glycoside hydrolase family 30 protein [Vallitalea sp. AN17-2]